MRWVKRKDDEGAVAVIVALSMVVLLAMGGLAVDVGMQYGERRELQNGADSAALAIAQYCSANKYNATQCQAALNTNATAKSFADKNSTDGKSALEGVLWPTANSVKIGTSTDTNLTKANGDSRKIRPFFSWLWNSDGTQVGAQATAAWGTLSSYGGLAVTFSHCEWLAATANGTVYAPKPPYLTPYSQYASKEVVLKLHGKSDTDCDFGPSGSDYPGGFGWLDPDTSTAPCRTSVTSGGWYGGDTGIGKPNTNGCDVEITRLYNTCPTACEVTYIPIFDDIVGKGGSTVDYHLVGFASFVITGIDYNQIGSKSSWVTGKALSNNVYGTEKCSGGDKCISGFFLEGLTPAGEIGVGGSYGVSVAKLTD